MEPRTRETLQLFVEKANQLTGRRFVKHVEEEGGLRIPLSIEAGGPAEIEENMPDEEALHALGLTLRLFVQDNERISLRNMGKFLDDPGLSTRWKEVYTEVRDSLNSNLDAPHPSIKIPMEDGRAPTRRDIFEAFLYGDLAHTSEPKRKQVLAWKQRGFAFEFVRHAFHGILVNVIGAIGAIAWASELELSGQEIPSWS